MELRTIQRKTIVVNGETTETQAGTLAELIAQLGFDESAVASALNGDFVPRHARTRTRLSANDRIEIVTPRQGG
jgi:sulfur carrier protein